MGLKKVLAKKDTAESGKQLQKITELLFDKVK